MIDWFTTTITSRTEGPPMTTLSLRTLVRNAAAVFSGCYGAVTRQAALARCSRQTVYDHAHRLERRLQPVTTAVPAAETPVPTPAAALDDSTRRRLAVTAFAMGISTRQIEDLLRVVLGADGPDHATISRWIGDAAAKAQHVLKALDAACVPRVETLAVDEIFFGGDRPASGSNRRA